VVDSHAVRWPPDIHIAVAACALSLAGCGSQPSSSSGQPRATSRQAGLATYYASSLAGRRTANGERYDPSLFTAAHRHLPFGTMVEVRRSDGRTVVVRINDRGPYGANRIIDLSRRAAEELGIIREGKTMVEIRAIGGAPR
jgi:rare lipoprotein A